MGLDHKQFKSFTRKFQMMTKQYNSFLNDFLIKCAMECLANTKKRTPVDTGELRRNWFIGSVIKTGNDLTIHLYNAKDYASYLEYGHTTRDREGWVEGYYMATISIEELNRKIPKRLEREFVKFVNSLGI